MTLFELLSVDFGRVVDDVVVDVDVVDVTQLVLEEEEEEEEEEEKAEGGRSWALSCSQLGLFSMTAWQMR